MWKVLKQENVSYIVAPYEADAQMTFLAVSKQVEAVITEDSDLIPFGCPRVSSTKLICLTCLITISIVIHRKKKSLLSSYCCGPILYTVWLNFFLKTRLSSRWTNLGKVLSFDIPCYNRTRRSVLQGSPSKCFLRCVF